MIFKQNNNDISTLKTPPKTTDLKSFYNKINSSLLKSKTHNFKFWQNAKFKSLSKISQKTDFKQKYNSLNKINGELSSSTSRLKLCCSNCLKEKNFKKLLILDDDEKEINQKNIKSKLEFDEDCLIIEKEDFLLKNQETILKNKPISKRYNYKKWKSQIRRFQSKLNDFFQQKNDNILIDEQIEVNNQDFIENLIETETNENNISINASILLNNMPKRDEKCKIGLNLQAIIPEFRVKNSNSFKNKIKQIEENKIWDCNILTQNEMNEIKKLIQNILGVNELDDEFMCNLIQKHNYQIKQIAEFCFEKKDIIFNEIYDKLSQRENSHRKTRNSLCSKFFKN